MASSVAEDNTVSAGDSLVGGAGTDTLNINIAGAAAATGAGVTTSGIETLAIANNGTAAVAVDATLMAGLKTIKVTGGQEATTVNNLDGIVDLSLVSTSKNVTAASVAAATAGASDVSSVTLNAVARTGSVDVNYNGVEAIKVTTTGTASGAANADGSVLYDVEFVGNAINTVTVGGTVGLVTKVGFNTTAQTVTQVNSFDASALNAGVNVTVANAGNSGLLSVKGSASADTVDLTALTITDKITVAGGEGSDTLKIGSVAAAVSGTQPGANISGFEVLSLGGGASVDLSALGTNAFTSATLNGAGTITKAVSTLQTINQVNTGNISYARATDGTADALTINLSRPAAAFSGSITAAGEETITINSNAGAASTVTSLSAAAATKLVVAGAQDLAVTTAATTLALATVDASGLTGTNVVGSTAFDLNASANTKSMTVTGSSSGRNVITTGTGNDSITGGSGNDALSGGLGADTLVGGAGNDVLTGADGNDNLSGGDGNDELYGNIGSDVLDGGAGDDLIDAGSGSDTITAGAGNDTLYMSSLNTDDNVDGGDGTDVLSANAVGTYFDRGDYVTATGDVAPTMKGVETAYVQFVASSANVSAATAETLDFTGVSGLNTLYLDLSDPFNGALTPTNDANMIVKNFGGSSIILSEKDNTTAGNPVKLTVDGTGQDLSITLRNFDGTTGTEEATVVTGVAALTIRGESTIATAAGSVLQTNNLGAVGLTANSVTGYTLSTSGSTSSIGANTGALTVAAASVTGAQSISLSSGAFDTLTTGIITAGTDVARLSITAGNDSVIKLGTAVSGNTTADIAMGTSSLTTSTITVGTGAALYDGAAGQEATLAATSLGVLTGNIGASATVDLSIAANLATGSTVTMSSNSTWTASALGGAGASSLTVSGVGDMDATSTVLKGTTFTLNVSGLQDADGVVVAADTGTVITVTGTAYADSVTGSTGADSIVGGAGNDTLGGGAGNDTINGGTGDDAITGGDGADTVYFGTGTDTFVHDAANDSTAGTVVSGVTDIKASVDLIYNAGNGDKINFALTTALASAITGEGSTSLITLADGTASNINLIRGTYNTTTGIFTAGTAATDDDYMLQAQDAEGASADTLHSIILMDLAGTVAFDATTAGLVTLTVA